jgi:hypothetical protein
MNQHEFEFEIYKCLKYGDESKIASAAGKGSSYYSQCFNPDDERESIFYRAARDFGHWAAINEEGARKAFAVFCSYVSRSMHEENELCHDTEICNTLKEVDDIATIRIKGGSLYEQLNETVQAEIQVRKLKAAILSKINTEKDSFNGRPRMKAPPAEVAKFTAHQQNGRNGK